MASLAHPSEPSSMKNISNNVIKKSWHFQQNCTSFWQLRMSQLFIFCFSPKSGPVTHFLASLSFVLLSSNTLCYLLNLFKIIEQDSRNHCQVSFLNPILHHCAIVTLLSPPSSLKLEISKKGGGERTFESEIVNGKLEKWDPGSDLDGKRIKICIAVILQFHNIENSCNICECPFLNITKCLLKINFFPSLHSE